MLNTCYTRHVRKLKYFIRKRYRFSFHTRFNSCSNSHILRAPVSGSDIHFCKYWFPLNKRLLQVWCTKFDNVRVECKFAFTIYSFCWNVLPTAMKSQQAPTHFKPKQCLLKIDNMRTKGVQRSQERAMRQKSLELYILGRILYMEEGSGVRTIVYHSFTAS